MVLSTIRSLLTSFIISLIFLVTSWWRLSSGISYLFFLLFKALASDLVFLLFNNFCAGDLAFHVLFCHFGEGLLELSRVNFYGLGNRAHDKRDIVLVQVQPACRFFHAKLLADLRAHLAIQV